MRPGLALSLICWATLAAAAPAQQAAPSSWWPFPQTATFITGDTWRAGSQTYRLYGVQSCLRDTYFTNAHGIKRDCGETSLSMLVNLVRVLHPLCTTIAATASTHTSFVVCNATLASGPQKGSRIDLGTALISTGWAFTALAADGRPFHPAYAAAETVAAKAHAGLWQFPDMPNPNATILSALNHAHITLGSASAAPKSR